jgi:hypothetical protein
MSTKLAVGGLMAAAVALAVAWPSGSVSAQYPPPAGNCVITTSATTTEPGGNVGVSVTVLDINGKPVPGIPTDLLISHQPGGDASLTGNASATDGQGVVKGTLGAGSTSGVIGLRARTADVFCAGSVVVGNGAVLAEVALPDTGSGTGSDGDSPAVFAVFLLGAIGVVGVTSAMSWRRTRRG